MKNTFTLIVFLLLVHNLNAQDAFFYGSNQINGYLNPALTGIYGSLSVSVIGKEQFLNNPGDFTSAGISIEESWPCVKIDGGIYHVYDREGDGLFTTNHTGMNFVYTLPFDVKGNLNNLRIGTKLLYTNKSIEWDRLYYSDQVHPKYNLTDAFGTPNSTSFIPPAWNSFSRLTIGMGVVYKADIGITRKWSFTMGLAAENYTNAFENNGYDSILGLVQNKNAIINKWSIHLNPEFPLSHPNKDYFGLRPSFVLLKENSLTNIQIGLDANYNRAYSFGMYLSSGKYKYYNLGTKSLVFNSSFRVYTNDYSQLNVSIQYIHNIGGISEVFGQTLQISLSYHLRKDGCSSTPNTKFDCPATSVRRAMLFENIWYGS